MHILILVAMLGLSAHAEEKFCAINEMHCEDCAQMVRDKICKDKTYATCDVKIIDEKTELGQLHLKTKDEAAKIDQPAINKALKPLGYQMATCQATALKAPKGKAL